ncbi:LTA synthase family protein [Mangrovibacterium marinum]|uniref:Phosphoglycerol transferase MdoB-like AlkP superfamily enzyme n=1 Tax=Mangrovibacterium marinum TaxID=1639118 RepID=A0A2T5C1Z0_9BACT|nr:alkaline phosphatase family protein [Mangrovibacterium marinum]PTN08671.1 phosphoglycerol transferase MdoB-like AlkP superfamily enzyme [Mangrovibacterium marinum]
MKKVILSFLKYYLFWLLFLTAFKVLFVVYNYPQVANLPAADFWGIFTHGIVMDLSVAGYFSMIPGLIFSLGFVAGSRFSTQLLKYYTLLALAFLTVLGLTDAGLYPAWGTRLNAQFLMYLETPGGIYASMAWWQLILFPLMTVVIVWLAFKAYNWWLSGEKLAAMHLKWWAIPVMLFLTAALIIPIRGGLDRAPMNHSNVYFSNSLEANQFAYNYFWNFMHDVLKNKKAQVEVHYMSDEEATAILEADDKMNVEAPQIIQPVAGKPTNIILVFLESFSNKVIEPLGGLPEVTPRLNEFCREGIAFKSFFATGRRSDKGMSALIGGRPSDMSRTTVLAFPDKMSKLDYFPKYLASQGYNMSFYYGGDVNFYNTRAVMIQSGIDKIISKSDFPLETGLKQKWGVPDEFLYARMFDDLKQEKEPFFSMVYNISSHEPFDIEGYRKFPTNNTANKYLNVVSYADSCLGVFIDSLKQTSLWEHSLVVITADHTSLEPGPTNITEPGSYRIPLILVGGVVKQHLLSDRFGNQNDLAPMLLKQLGLHHKKDLLSKDFLTDNNYAFYFNGQGWGFMAPEAGWFLNTNTGKQDFFYNNAPAKVDSLMHFAKAYVQYLHDGHLQE